MVFEEDSLTGQIDVLYRQHARRITAHLSRKLGLDALEKAEDAVQEAFARAVTVWAKQGIPQKPEAWIYRVSMNVALEAIRKDRFSTLDDRIDIDAESQPSVRLLADSELEAMFLCCHPSLPPALQVALTLRTLSGWPVPRIADAFFLPYDKLEKRLTRARERVRAEFSLDLHLEELAPRLPGVLHVLYLGFSEGYFSNGGGDNLQLQVSAEAMRLVALLVRHDAFASLPEVHALYALMCFHAARFPARVGVGFVDLARQDRTLWDASLIQLGFAHLAQSAQGDHVSPYHIEAGIASVHLRAPSLAGTDWGLIVSLYDKLVVLAASPAAYLSRAVALLHHAGPAIAGPELEALTGKVPEGLRKLALAEVARAEGADNLSVTYAQEAAGYMKNPQLQAFMADKWG